MMGRDFGNIALENGEDNSLRWRAPFFREDIGQILKLGGQLLTMGRSTLTKLLKFRRTTFEN